MGIERQHAREIEPLLAAAVDDPEVAMEGSRELERILVATEQELAGIQQRAYAAGREISEDADRRAQQLALEHRDRVAELRVQLEAREAALAVRFETLLDGLLAAERELSRRAGQPEPVYDVREAHWRRAIQVTLRERMRFEVSHESPPDLGAGEPPDEPPKRRRRWWRRWLREAA
jgi:hypothetical protein